MRETLDRLAAERGADVAGWSDPVLQTRFATANAHAIPQGADGPVALPLAERGTENHLVELRASGAVGRNVVAPGQAEEGAVHRVDQVGFFRDFAYKAMPFTAEEISQATEKSEFIVDPYR